MTPFQKKFHNADKDTVFVVTHMHRSTYYNVSDRVTLGRDDRSSCPYFRHKLHNHGISICLDNLELAEPEQPEFKLGDKIEGKDNGDCAWCHHDMVYIADSKDANLSHIFSKRYLCMFEERGTITSWDQVRHAKTTETIRFEDGTEKEISADKAKELRESS